jgi:hypothetical protein
MNVHSIKARFSLLRATRERLSQLSERERRTLINLCVAFALTYGDILPLLNYLGRARYER